MGPQDWLDAIQRKTKKDAQKAKESPTKSSETGEDKHKKERRQKIEEITNVVSGFLGSTDGRLGLMLLEVTGEKITLLTNPKTHEDSYGIHIYLGGAGIMSHLSDASVSELTKTEWAIEYIYDSQCAGRSLPDGVVADGKKLVSFIRHRLDIISKKY